MRLGTALELLRGQHASRWLAIAGIITISLCGGIGGWLDSNKILELWLALIAAIFAAKAIEKKGGGPSG